MLETEPHPKCLGFFYQGVYVRTEEYTERKTKMSSAIIITRAIFLSIIANSYRKILNP